MRRAELRCTQAMVEIRFYREREFGAHWPGFVVLLFTDLAGRVLGTTRRLFSRAAVNESVDETIQANFLSEDDRFRLTDLIFESLAMAIRSTRADRIETACGHTHATYFLQHLFRSVKPEQDPSRLWAQCRSELPQMRPSVEFFFSGIARSLPGRAFSLPRAKELLDSFVEHGFFSAKDHRRCLAEIHSSGLADALTQEDRLHARQAWDETALRILGLVPGEPGSGDTRIEATSDHAHLFFRGIKDSMACLNCLCDARICIDQAIERGHIHQDHREALLLQAVQHGLPDHGPDRHESGQPLFDRRDAKRSKSDRLH